MPAKLSQSTTVEDTQEVELSPEQRTKLLTEFNLYLKLSEQIKSLEMRRDEVKARLGALREEIGKVSVSTDGFKVTLVAPVRSKLDHKRLIALGCAPAWIKEATRISPAKSYEKVTCPGDKDEPQE